MKLRTLCVILALASALVCTTVAQTAAPNSSPASTQVPRLIRFSGVALDEASNPMTGVLGITFSLYQDQQGGSPLWLETQNVQANAIGHYTVLLGSASAEGMPLELFSSGEAQWLGVQIQGQPERARVLLVSVPYALKAHDAETLSGRSISDFVLLNKASSSSSSNATDTPAGSNATSPSSWPRIDNDGPTNFMGSNATQIVSVTQSGGGLGLSATSHALAAVAGTITGKSNTAVYGLASNTSRGSNAAGVTGQSNTETGPGVAGYANGSGTGVIGVANATTGYANGVYGQSASTSGSGLSGNATAASGYTSGVYGQSASANGTGVYGSSANWVGVGGQGATLGVWGDSATINGTGVAGYSDATSGSGDGVYGQSASPGGTGVVGVNDSTSGTTTGVAGTIVSASGAGVTGNATAASGYTNGVYGQNSSNSGYGVNGNAIATSGYNVGVYGQTQSNSGYGVYGLANATGSAGAGGIGVIGINNGSNGSAGSFGALAGQGLILQGWGNNFTQVFSVDANGNLDISGNLTVAGGKSARVKLPDGREVALYAVESPENWFEDFGTGQLQGGKTEVSLEPGFLQTVDTAADYHVFLTANGDCHGLYIAHKTRTGFEVRELGHGSASVAFDYRIVARRRGFENVRLQDVHLPQGPRDMQVRLASMRSGGHTVAPPAPRITVPALPNHVEQAR
jgi:trimeric autotransporter adhesin